jgi:hypothetical protein
MSHAEMQQLLNKIQTDFYIEEGGKNTFFKNAQKQKCSELITSQINIYDLLQQTVFIIPNTNQIYLEYPLLKQFANNSNGEEIINYIISMINHCIIIYGQYEMHINLKGFSISAAERYKSSIQLFCTKCCNQNLNTNTSFAKLLINMYIYNTPSIIDTITKLFSSFMDPCIPQKLVLLPKDTSSKLLDVLLSKK